MANSIEFKHMLNKLPNNKEFTSQAIGSYGKFLKMLVNKKIVILVGRDK